MIDFSVAARSLIGLASLVLLGPVLTIPLNDEASLRQFHNRSLTSWPTAQQLLRDPSAYAGAMAGWVSDRAGPIVVASVFEKAVLYYGLRTPPQRRVSLGRDGFIFLNGAHEHSRNGLLRNQCLRSHLDSTYRLLAKHLPSLRDTSARLGVAVHAMAVPMTPTLYADRLPLSVPEELRSACLEAAKGEGALPALSRERALHFVYPFEQMKARRETRGFFPKASYHPNGLSVTVFRDAYLERLGFEGAIDEELQLDERPSEIMATYRLEVMAPEFVVSNTHVSFAPAARARLRDTLRELFPQPPQLQVYENGSGASRTALMLSDSVGINAAPIFAGAFERLVWVDMNGIRDQRDAGEVVRRVMAIQPLDAILLLRQEGGVETFAAWADSLASLPTSPAVR